MCWEVVGVNLEGTRQSRSWDSRAAKEEVGFEEDEGGKGVDDCWNCGREEERKSRAALHR
jgi:hypothetical protein